MVAQPVSQPRAAVYVRVSSARQEAEGTSLDSQESYCREHAAAHGYDVAEVYREVFTGTELWDRPRLNQLRGAIRAGDVDALIVHATDRLSRDPIHLAILAEECERHGAELLFVTEPLDNTPEGALIRYVKGYAAKIENEKRRERSVRGKHTRAQLGQLHNSGIDLYGYRRDKEARTRAVHEGEAAVVRQVFRWVGEDRLPISEVVRRLNESGTPPPSAGKVTYDDPDRVPRWGKGAVQRILRNPAYKGEAYAWRYRRSKTNGRLIRPEEEWIRLPGEVSPAIVSPELWQAAQDRLDSNTGAETRNQARPYLLRGHIYCGVCGRRMRASPLRGNRMYRCSSRETPSGACGAGRVPAEKLEAWFWAKLDAAIRDPSLITAQASRRREEGPDAVLTEDLETARRSLAKLTGQQDRLLHRMRDADGGLWDLLEREIGRIEQEKGQVTATIADIEGRLARQQAAVEQMEALAEYCRAVADRLDGFDFDKKRLAVEAFAVQVMASGNDEAAWWWRGSIPLDGAGKADRPSRWSVRPRLTDVPRCPPRATCTQLARGQLP
jgi:site-specific DNA recombinase